MRSSLLVRALCPLLAVLTAACGGNGSDIGPALGAKPPEPFQVQVLDDQSRPVCGAVVQWSGASAVSGRVGRAESGVRPGGPGRFGLDAGAASARDGDVLEGFAWLGEPIDGARGLGRAVFVPDLAASAGLTLPTGVQAAPALLDDSATSGATLQIAAGTVVADGTAALVTLRTASLLPRHLPLAPPPRPGFAVLATRAIAVAPASVTFAPGAVLTVPDELAASSSAVAFELHRLDRDTGTWVQVGSGAAAGGRIATAAPGIDRGGLYVLTVAVPSTCTLHGRVLDARGAAVRGALVHAGGQATLSDSGGAFVLPPLAAIDLAGSARGETVEVVGGRGYLPVSASADVVLADGPLVLPDITLDTVATGHVRLLLVERGVVLTEQRVRTNQTAGEGRADVWVDGSGSAVLEDVAAGFYAVVFGRPGDVFNGFRTDGLFRLGEAERVADVRLFSVRTGYDERRRGNNIVVFDRAGGGLVENAGVVLNADPDRGFAGRTREGGTLFAGVPRDGQVTAVADTTRDGKRVLSAFTAVYTSAHRLELPVLTAARAPTGAFDRHGLVEGTVTGGTAGRSRALRATTPLTYREWFERVMLDDDSSGGRVPIERAPAGDTTIAFRAGVPRPRGHLALTETRSGSGREVLDSAFVAFDQAPAEGTTAPVSGTLALADTTFSVPTGGPDARITELVADWGAEAASGTIADVTRGTVPVGVLLMGSSRFVDLPALAGPFAGGRHHVCLRGAATVGAVTVEQRQVATLTNPGTNPAAPMLAPPAITAPLPGAVVSADGFSVTFVPPPGATYLVLRLVSDTAPELRDWTVLLPGNATAFTFLRLPSEVAQMLTGGRSWTLELSAFRIVRGPLWEQPDPYTSLLANFVSMGPGALGVDALARVSFTISTP